MSPIPEDLLYYEVLQRLPMRPLQRFRRVSKSWRAQIDCPKFIRLYLNQAKYSDSTDVRIIVNGIALANSRISRELRSTDINPFVYVSDILNTCTEEKQERIDLPAPMSQFLGSCNGLICVELPKVTEASELFLLLNPFTLKQWILPPYPAIGSKLFYFPGTIVCGFGYATDIDDYKVVTIKELRRITSEGIHEIATEMLQVYSLKSNSWRRVAADCSFLSRARWFERTGVSVGGALHWIIETDQLDGGESIILSFDLSSEEFHQVPWPEYPNYISYGLNTLGSLGGCLCVVNHVQEEAASTISDVWVMNDYGIKDSWTKFTRLELPAFVRYARVSPLEYLKDQKQVLLEFDHDLIMIYDLEMKRSRIIVRTSRGLFRKACVCFDSLRQPPGIGGIGGKASDSGL